MKHLCVIVLCIIYFSVSASAEHVQGEVIDLDGNPVPNAEVCISYTTHSLAGYIPFVVDWNAVVHHKWIKTKKDGHFSIHGFRGFNWTVSGAHGARKTGYEYQYPMHVDSTNHMFHIRMRKRLNPCFLHHEPYADCQFKIPGRAIAWDFILREQLQVDPPKRRPNSSWPLPKHTPDVLIRAQFDSSNQVWNVVFEGQGSSSRILATTNTMYEAPAEGYLDNLSFSVRVSRQASIGAKCIVIRSRTPSIFTRLNVTHVVSTDQFLRLSFDAYTNPYGERALDIDPRVEKDYFIQEKLIEDSKKAWQEGHPPAKPDFQTLLQAVNEFKEN